MGAFELDPRTGAARWNVEPQELRLAHALPRERRASVRRGRRGRHLGRQLPRRPREDESATGGLTRYQHDTADPQASRSTRCSRSTSTGRAGLWVALENGGLDCFDFATETFTHKQYDPNNPTGLNSNSIWGLFAIRPERSGSAPSPAASTSPSEQRSGPRLPLRSRRRHEPERQLGARLRAGLDAATSGSRPTAAASIASTRERAASPATPARTAR